MILYIQQGAMSTPVFSEPQMKLWGQEQNCLNKGVGRDAETSTDSNAKEEHQQ
jgi:hypothetical protein